MGGREGVVREFKKRGWGNLKGVEMRGV